MAGQPSLVQPARAPSSEPDAAGTDPRAPTDRAHLLRRRGLTSPSQERQENSALYALRFNTRPPGQEQEKAPPGSRRAAASAVGASGSAGRKTGLLPTPFHYRPAGEPRQPARQHDFFSPFGQGKAARARPEVKAKRLRYSHASALISARVDIVSVSRRLGHGSPSVTLSVYPHRFHKNDDAAVHAIEAATRPRK